MPITWGSLLGVTLLWGRFEHAGWQRRVGLLLVMSLVDAGFWFLDHGAALGLAEGDLGHDWLRENVGQALGWAEFALMAGLSCEYLEHLGVEYARESGKSTRSMAATGAVVWLLLFCQRTNWSGGWPLVPHRIRSIEEYPALPGVPPDLGDHSDAGDVPGPLRRRGCRAHVLAEMKLEDEANDPFKPPVGVDQGAGRPRGLTPGAREAPQQTPAHDDPAGSNSRSDRGSGKWTLSSRIVSSRMLAPKLR